MWLRKNITHCCWTAVAQHRKTRLMWQKIEQSSSRLRVAPTLPMRLSHKSSYTCVIYMILLIYTLIIAQRYLTSHFKSIKGFNSDFNQSFPLVLHSNKFCLYFRYFINFGLNRFGMNTFIKL